MTVHVVTFHDEDGNGGTHSYVVGVFATEDWAESWIQTRRWPRDWYSVDKFGVQ